MRVGRIALVAAAVGVVVVGLAVWLVARGLQARSHLLDFYDSASTLRDRIVSGDTSGVPASLAAIQREAGQAHDDTDDPVWRLCAHLPLVGRTVQVVRGAAAADVRLADDVLPQMVQAAEVLSPRRLRPAGNRILLSPLHKAVPTLTRATASIDAVQASVARLPSSGVLGTVARARNRLLHQLETLAGTTRTAGDFARIAPAMLGEDGPRHYFVAVQNNAEARGTGGLVGAYLILEANRGVLTVRSVGSDTQLRDTVRPAIDPGAEFDRLYGPYASTSSWRNSNLSPDFPVVASIWTSLWRATTGERLDGAMAIDPDLMADVLGVTGPVELPDRTTVSATNAVTLTESAVYQRYADNQTARKDFLRKVAKAVADKVLSGAGDATALAHALGADAGEHHLALWSSRPTEESVIGGTPLGARLPPPTRPVTDLFVNNLAGSKLDFWLRRTVVRSVGGCRPDGTRDVTVTVRLTNSAPAGLPGYVVTRADNPNTRLPRGTNRLLVSVLLTHGAELLGVTLDGRTSTVTFGAEAGLASASTTLELLPKTTRVLTLHLAEPGGGAPDVPEQPLAVAQVSEISAAAPCTGGG